MRIPWGWVGDESNVKNWLPKTFSGNPDVFHVSSGNCGGWAWNENSESSHVDWKRETTFHHNLIPHLENLQNHSKTSILACVCCNCEVSCWIVSWFSLNFWIDISSTCCTCALSIFSNSCILRICVSRRALSFRINSCRRACSRRDSTNPYCAFCNSNLWA